eukprot:9757183-Prorocentrum_lima.AAC.1
MSLALPDANLLLRWGRARVVSSVRSTSGDVQDKVGISGTRFRQAASAPVEGRVRLQRVLAFVR